MSLSKDLAKFSTKTKAKMDTVLRKSAFRMAAEVDIISPVDTGRFRANWIGAIGSINRATFESSRDAVGEASLILNGLEVGGNIFFYTNSLPYALSLEYGNSLQAPRGIIRVKARNWSRYVKEEVLRVQ